MKMSTFGVANGLAPKQGPVALTTELTLVADVAQTIDLTEAEQNDAISFIQSVFVDNDGNAAPVVILTEGINQPLVVPANSQGIFPLFTLKPTKIAVESTGAQVVKFVFLNVPMPTAVWSTAAAGSGLTAADFDAVFAGAAYTDQSGTIAVGGTSQTLMAANAARKRILVQNPITATEALYINFTDAASTGGDSIELLPGGSYSEQAPCTPELITIVAATGAHAFIAKEM